MYLAHSSLENYKSVRFPGSGSPFIQTLCKAITEKWQTYNLMHIFTNDVASTLQSWETCFGEKWNLTPEFRVLGTSTCHEEKTLYLTLQPQNLSKGT